MPAAAVPRVVDVHIHFLPGALLAALLGRTAPPFAERVEGRLVLDFGDGYTEVLDERLTRSDAILESLAAAGVDAAVLSINQPGVLRLPTAQAQAVARDANDELAELVRRHPGTFAGLATLPWQDTDAAVDELERAASLGLRGAMVCSNIAGAPLDAPAFDPTFAAAAARSQVLLLHPTVPASVTGVREHGLICGAGFLFDTTTAILRLIFSGTFDRHPDLHLLLAHAGSLLPLLSGRLDREYARTALPVRLPDGRTPGDYVRRLHTDTIAGSPRALELAVDLFGSERVCFGSDYPFGDQRAALELVRAADLPAETMDAVCGANAERLFGLGPGERAAAVRAASSAQP